MIQVFDTRTRKKEPLDPVHPGEVRIYVCGPTVYNLIHIGNARTFLSFDAIRRYLVWRGLKVTFVQNVTDIDDKIINAATAQGVDPAELAKRYETAFIENMRQLGVEDPDVRPHATDEIEGMIALVELLIDKGHAYVASEPADEEAVAGRKAFDVYFEVRGLPSYGSLSGRSLEDMRAGERVEVNPLKRDPMDFALWKAAKPDEPWWDSPWGPGRPGWHLECSVMSAKYLGLPFDIHGGATDLVFPHHENEKAQSEAAYGQFVRHWIHGGLLNIDQEKMSKSAGNFMLLKEILTNLESAADEHGHPRYPSEADRANVIRMLMLGTHYRSPLDYSPERLDEAGAAVERLATAVRNLLWLEGLPDGTDGGEQGAALAEDAHVARRRFTEVMDDDFNTAGALGVVFELVRRANALTAAVTGGGIEPGAREGARGARAELVELAGVLGVRLGAGPAYPAELVAVASELAGYAGADPAEAAEAVLARRAEARSAKDWAAADTIRDRLAGLGLVVEDTPQGQRIAARG